MLQYTEASHSTSLTRTAHLTPVDEPGGEWAVTLSDYHGNRDIATIAMFATRAEAEVFIGRIRNAR
jgi:hypothetical protein